MDSQEELEQNANHVQTHLKKTIDSPHDYTENVEEKFKEELEQNGMAAAAGKMKSYLENLDHVTLNIAITGESGSGKSTLVNAFRGLDDEDEGAAPTGVVQTTMEPAAYPHPHFPNVQLWDLPGIGTPNFKAAEYLQQVGFDEYDFFIIVSSDRFKENDVKLAVEIQKKKKKFYFVRSKIDHSLDDERRKKSFNEEATKQKIRDYCIEGLKTQQIETPTVFLISSFQLDKYDFPALTSKLEEDLPSHKKDALLMSLPNISLEVHYKKKKSFESRLWIAAVASGVGGLVPLPGFSFVVDVAILVAQVTRYYHAFGLNPKALRRLADRVGMDVEELSAVVKSPLNKGITPEVIVKLLTVAGTTGTLMLLEEGLQLLPVVGSILAGSLSFITTYTFLKKCLDELADDAQNVLMKALNINPSSG